MARLTMPFAMAILLMLLFGLASADGGSKPKSKSKSCNIDISYNNFKKVLGPCFPFVDVRNKSEPKAEDVPKKCCNAFKKADVSCICAFIPEDLANKYVSMEKFVFAAQQCSVDHTRNCIEKKLEPGTKCGNYTVPPSELGREERQLCTSL